MVLLPTLYLRKQDDSLENHVATVAHYVNFVLANKRSPEVMSHRFPEFTEYLVTRSWRKMYRRIHHWSSQGFIYELSQVDETALRAVVEPAVVPLRNDVPLAIMLGGLESSNLVPVVISHTCTNTPLMIPALFAACRDMETMPRSDQPENLPDEPDDLPDGPDDLPDGPDDLPDGPDDPPNEPADLLDEPDEISGLYNKDTCVEFHQLLISTLLSLGKGLEEYAAANRNYNKNKDPQSFADLVNCADRVCECGTLLWVMGYSQILANHLKILRNEGWIRLPENSQKNLDKYRISTGFEWKKNQVISLDLGGVDRGVDKVVKGSEAGVKDCGQPGEDEDEDYKMICKKAWFSGKLDLACAFREWIRLQVDRFQAARKMTSFLKHTRIPTVSLALLAVRHPKPMTGGEAIDPWRKTIMDIYTEARGGVVEANNIIRMLNVMIRQANPNSIFTQFHSPQNGTYEYNASLHCKIVMMAIDKFGDRVVGTDTLKNRIRVWFDFGYHPGVGKSDASHKIWMTA